MKLAPAASWLQVQLAAVVDVARQEHIEVSAGSGNGDGPKVRPACAPMSPLGSAAENVNVAAPLFTAPGVAAKLLVSMTGGAVSTTNVALSGGDALPAWSFATTCTAWRPAARPL